MNDNTPGDYFVDLANVTIGNEQSENIVSSYSGGTITVNESECTSGSIIYNTDTNNFNFCENGVWVEK